MMIERVKVKQISHGNWIDELTKGRIQVKGEVLARLARKKNSRMCPLCTR